MGRNRKDLSTTSKVVRQLSFAALSKSLPRATVEQELARHSRKEKRTSKLPAHLMVYYTLAMCLHSQVGLEEVLRWVLEEARGLFGLGEVKVATKGAISLARQRLGSGVMEALYGRVAVPVAQAHTKGAWHEALRVVALDGSTLDLQDTGENAAHYGYAKGKRGESAFPKLRFVALVEVGTHVLFGARMGPYAKSEQALGAEVIGALRPGMLCTADRLFHGFDLWEKARQSGADLLWRVKNNLRLPVEKQLEDGSYLSTLYASDKHRRKNQNGRQVRVIEYQIKTEEGVTEKFRLISTLLDSKKHPADKLVAVYPQRWEIELSYDEYKTHLRGGQVVLRSMTPDLVKQEFYAFMLTHYCTRHLMHEAALANDIEPVRLSYTHTVEVIKRKLPAFKAGFSPLGHEEAAQADDMGDRRGGAAAEAKAK
jgi:hypothetical protein